MPNQRYRIVGYHRHQYIYCIYVLLSFYFYIVCIKIAFSDIRHSQGVATG